MTAISRRLWDSCVVLGYLSGQREIKSDCDLIVAQAERGELEIVVSTIAQAEVAYLSGLQADEAEARIVEFFSQRYIVTAAFDISLTKTVRRLIREYKGLKPFDAIHVATALQWQIPIMETTDADLLKMNINEGIPKLIIRPPAYQGPAKLFQF